MTNCIVIIPTYNERENIEKMLRKVFSLSHPFDVLVVDDGSPDGTAGIVRNLLPSFPGRLFLEVRKEKLGLGTAYIHGFRWALQRTAASDGGRYEYFFEMDCDFSHDPEDLNRLYLACSSGGADVAIGSRYTGGGKILNWPIGRVLMSYFASLYVRIILWFPVKDTTAGFKCYRRAVLEKIDLGKIKFMGYAFQIEMKYAAWKHGFKVKEVPITFTDRKEGTSKMTKGIFKEAFLGVLEIKWGSMQGKYE